MAALPHSSSLRDVAICVSLMTESFRRRTSGEVMVWGVNASNPDAMTWVNDGWRGDGEQCLAGGSRMRRYDTVQEPLGVHAFGEPIGTWLQYHHI